MPFHEGPSNRALADRTVPHARYSRTVTPTSHEARAILSPFPVLAESRSTLAIVALRNRMSRARIRSPVPARARAGLKVPDHGTGWRGFPPVNAE